MQTFYIAKIREEYDLRNLENYGFRKTEHIETDVWWQRIIESKPYKQDVFIVTCQLCVNEKDRILLTKADYCKDPDGINSVVLQMKQDGVFEDFGYLRCKDKICDCRERTGGDDNGDYYFCKCTKR